MAFDPTKPANNSPLSSQEMRGQFTALKDLIDQRPTSDDLTAAIAGGSANNIEGMADLSLTLSDPPTHAQVQEILTKLNQLIDALQH